LIAAIVPAHNEQDHLKACIESLQAASRCPSLRGEEVLVVVVLDACTDASARIVRASGATAIEVDIRNVGAARAIGARLALDLGARWLAFTDADTEVDPAWLSTQLGLEGDAVCGTIAVRNWDLYGERMERHFAATYTDRDGHRHIHGANLGVSASAYLSVGGFPSLACSEDVAFVRSLQDSGANIVWSAAPRVFTSARRSYRAPGGFGATLERIHVEGSWASAELST
jgi:glycosyltransferase involved in cell wall biosynthesis